jgi:phosphopantothenoylcysteine decarboxylase/phosphopantothenate--cysteine ligase
MYEAVLSRARECDVLIAAAAPADYAPASPATQKIKKEAEPLTIEFEPTPDILAECGRRKQPGQLLVGFAAETENLLVNAGEKLRSKNLDLIVANEVSGNCVGIDSDRNAGHILFASGERVELPVMNKDEFAQRVLDAVVQQRAAAQDEE